MRLNIFLFTAILSAITFTSNAQSPGYMGKKFIAKVELLTTPTFYKKNDINDYEIYEDAGSIKPIGFSITPSIGIEYVLGKGVAAGIALRTSSLKMPMHIYIEETYLDERIDEYVSVGYLGEVKLKSNMTSMYFKFYPHQKRGAIAPLGRFHQLEYIFGHTTYTNGKSKITDPTDPTIYNNGTGTRNYILYEDVSDLGFEEKIPFQMLKYAYGFETVIKDKIPLEMSLQFAFSVTDYISELTGNGIYGNSEGENEFIIDVSSRLSRSLNLTFNIGLGYLVF